MSSSKASLVIRSKGLILRLRDDRVLRNNAIYVSGGLLAGLFGYIFHFETGRLLGPSGYAVVASALAALYLLTLPVLSLQLVSARFTSQAAARNDSSAIRAMLLRITGFTLLLGLPVFLALVVVAPAVAQYLNIVDKRVVLILGLATIFTMLVTVNRGALQGLRRFIALSSNMALDTGSRLVLAGGFVVAGFGALGAVAAVAIGPFIAYGQSLFLLRRLPKADAAAERIEGLGRYALLAAATGIGINYLLSIDTLLAKHYLGAESAGIYAAAVVLARVVYFLGLSVTGVMFPEVATLHARNEAHFHVVDLSLLLIGGMGIAMIFAYVAFPNVVLLPYGATFAPVRPYLGPFAVALTMLTVANLLINYFLSIARARLIAPLLGACVLETTLIVLFHAGIGQILTMVLLSLGALALAMGVLYAIDRFHLGRILA